MTIEKHGHSVGQAAKRWRPEPCSFGMMPHLKRSYFLGGDEGGGGFGALGSGLGIGG